jgi:hypothetical protein
MTDLARAEIERLAKKLGYPAISWVSSSGARRWKVKLGYGDSLPDATALILLKQAEIWKSNKVCIPYSSIGQSQWLRDLITGHRPQTDQPCSSDS